MSTTPRSVHAQPTSSPERALHTPVARTRARARAARAAVAVAAVVGTAASCSTSASYTPTALPTASATTTSGSPATPVTCDNPTQSYEPLAALDAAAVPERIRARGRLVVGVSGDTYLFGARNPQTNRIEGFDIDLAKAVAKAIFGDENKLTLRVISADDRLPLLQSGEVDMVARNMTMNCARWASIAFSGEYYRAGLKVLVAKSSPATGFPSLSGARVCAPAGTTSLTKLSEFSGVVPVAASNHTGCLVLFQQGRVDAISGDDTVLAGLAAQDPYTKVVGDAVTAEPYGLGFNAEDQQLVRYVNRLLEDMKRDGRWKAIYDTWLSRSLGPAPAPPAGVYGR